MRFAASAFYRYYRPSRCELRVHLHACGLEPAPRSPYSEVLLRLGVRHEQQHLATLGPYLDLGDLDVDERLKATRQAVVDGVEVIYQGALGGEAVIDGRPIDVLGYPDYMLRRDSGYLIRDSKLSRTISEAAHPEVLRQLETYGWMYSKTFGEEPRALEVHAGTNEVVEIDFDGGRRALDLLGEMARWSDMTQDVWAPVGWSKCAGCGFRDHCWPAAEARRDVALVVGIDQGTARELRDIGVETVDQLLADFDERRLAKLERPWGQRRAAVGPLQASRALTMARSLAEGRDLLLVPPAIPLHPSYVMFDLEGLPPQEDELDKVFVWGYQVFGQGPTDFRSAVPGLGPDGDREGWRAFLRGASELLASYGDIPWVHWHNYERVKLDSYIVRYGDPNGIAARVRANLLDLLPVMTTSVALPIPSYSLKVVEEYLGYERTFPDVDGDWAMARWIEATETADPRRSAIIEEVLAYNREDLEATWAIFEWLRDQFAGRAM